LDLFDPGRRVPLSAPRRYYPGFFGALFLILLRTAIGWHFLYEGTLKILSTPEGKASVLAKIFPVPEGPVFTSEPYLRASSGPLAHYFRALIPDVDSRDKLNPAKIKESWKGIEDQVVKHYGFDASQIKEADAIVKSRSKVADEWFESLENRERIRKYFDELAEVEAIERNPNAMSYELENAIKDRKTAEADRKELVKEVDPLTETLRDALAALAKPDQTKEAGKYQAPWTRMDWLDRSTMWGLTSIGFCLLLGLFTPAAALGGATYLLSFYLSMPPWPGLPEGITEGHYRYVNKNLVELIALLALAATPNGLWIGLDALLFGWIGRNEARREADRIADLERKAAEGDKPQPQDRRKFKNR